MTTQYTFNSKETYLAARAEWKANYAHLTEQARKLRAEYNESQSLFAKTPSYNNHTAYWAAYKEVQKIRDERDTLRREANTALADLFNMKQEAAAQWEAARALA